MDDRKKIREELIKENASLRDRLERIEAVLNPGEMNHNLLSDYPFLNNPMGFQSPEEQILFTRFFIEVAADEVFWMRADSGIFYVNDSTCNRLGFSREELIGMHVWDWDPIFTKEVWDQFWIEIQLEGSRIFETKHRSKNGEVFPVEIAATVFKYSGEKFLFAFAKDISDRKKKDTILSSEQRKYKIILETAVDGFWLTDLKGRLLEVNDAYCRMSGYTEAELLSMSISALEGKMDCNEVASKIDDVLKNGYERFETKHRHKDGSLYDVEISVQTLHTEDTTKLVIFVRDISPQILMEHSLREQEIFLRSLLKAVPDLVWLKDMNGVYLACNIIFERFFGALERDIVGKTDYDFLEKDQADFFREKDQNAIAHGKSVKNEEWITFADDGHHALLETIKTPVYDHQGNLIGVLGIGRDITKRKETEEAILRSERKFRNFLESTSTVPWELDLAKNRFSYMGKQIEKVLGYSAESWIDINTWKERLHPDDRQQAVSFFEQETGKGNDHDSIYRAIHKDGSVRWIRNVVSVVTDSGEPKNLVGFLQDITEQKNIELEKESISAQLQQAQKMEAIGTLAGGIAHDFNNILGVIIGYTELAKVNCPDGDLYQKSLDQVLAGADRAKDLIKQILVFSRHVQENRIPVKMQPLIKEVLMMIRSSIPATINITTNIDPDCGTVLADPIQIHQILMNLCTNAYHAMEKKGGTLSLTLKTTVVTPEDKELLIQLNPGEFIELIVTDTGSGISPDIIKNIFEPYFTTKELGKGTGMGLAIIHGIVLKYGGMITAKSELGKGAAFHVYFPTVREGIPVDEKRTEEIPRGTERILFIDDEILLAQMGREMLGKLGYQVTVRSNSLKALETFKKNPDQFDMVITDQTMPEMTGSELASRMMAIRPDIPIILCTGFSNLINEESAKELGIKDFIYKPISTKMIAILIRKVLDENDRRH